MSVLIIHVWSGTEIDTDQIINCTVITTFFNFVKKMALRQTKNVKGAIKCLHLYFTLKSFW